VSDLQTPASDPAAPALPEDVPGAPAADAPAAPAAGRKGATEVEPLARAHAVLARRTAESRATVPDVTYAVEVDMGEAEALGPSSLRSRPRPPPRRFPATSCSGPAPWPCATTPRPTGPTRTAPGSATRA
jgi:hypothetical protein